MFYNLAPLVCYNKVMERTKSRDRQYFYRELSNCYLQSDLDKAQQEKEALTSEIQRNESKVENQIQELKDTYEVLKKSMNLVENERDTAREVILKLRVSNLLWLFDLLVIINSINTK